MDRRPIILVILTIWLLLNGISIISGPVTAVIIEETKDRAALTAEQVAILTSVSFPQAIRASGGTFLGCFDKDIVDRDKKLPADIIPYLEAAKKMQLPALVYKRGNSVKAIQLPVNEKAALEALK